MSFSCIVFRYCLAYSHLSKVNSPLIPEKKIEGKQKLLRKIYYLSVRVKAEIVCHINIAAREQKQSFLSKS